MSSQIHQLQLTFVPSEDRLLFRINTSTHEEHRLWLTRRYVKLLWQALHTALRQVQADDHQTATLPPQSRSAIRAFQHEAAVSQADYQTSYREPEQPITTDPILISRLALRQQNSTQILCFYPQEGEGVELGFNEQLLHWFSKLLIDAVDSTGWDISLKMAPDLQTTNPSVKH